MNKTAHTELHRLFLIDKLPDPLNPASSHIQVFDNYILNTRIRVRSIRDPYTNAWTRILQQRFVVDEDTRAVTKLAEMYLNDEEYALFERFEGHEIRKNRYFHEFDLVNFTFDTYLGDLWGLHTARVDLESLQALEAFEPPPFAVYEVTSDPFFDGISLVGKKFPDVQAEIGRLQPLRPTAFEMAAE